MMRIKYVNPNSNLPYVAEVTDAFIAHDVDDEGNELQSFVIVIHCADSVEHALSIRGESFSALVELMNELYDNGKIDVSTNANIEISAIPRSIIDMFDMFGDAENITPDMLDDIISDFYEDDDYDDEEDY